MNFTLLVIVVGVVAITNYIVKQWIKENKVILVGLLFLDFGAILTGIRIFDNEILFRGNFDFLVDIAFWSTILGSIFIVIGGFIKLRNDPYRKRLFIIASVIICVSIAWIIFVIFL